MNLSDGFLFLAKQNQEQAEMPDAIRSMITTAERGYGINEGNYKEFLSKRNRIAGVVPKIVLYARCNQSGNLQVTWRSAAERVYNTALPDEEVAQETGFVPEYLRYCDTVGAYASYRPANELIWFRQFGTLTGLNAMAPDSPFVALAFGLQAAYESFCRELSKSCEIVSAPRLEVEFKDDRPDELVIHYD